MTGAEALREAADLLGAKPVEDAVSPLLATLDSRITPNAAKRQALDDECKDALSHANKEQVFARTLDCVRVTLQLEATGLRALLLDTRANTEPLIGALRADAQALLDAVTAVIDAVDTGVYASENGLLQTRTRLQEKYRLPFQRALLGLHWEALRMRLLELHAVLHVPEHDAEAHCVLHASRSLKENRTIDGLEEGMAAYEAAATSLRDCLQSITATGSTLP